MKHHGRRPHIALTPDLGSSQSRFPAPEYQLKSAYVDAVFRAGGLPWVVPYTDDRACTDAFLDRVAGLVLTGGGFDIPPQAYGETPAEGLGPTKPERTRFETLLLEAALERKIPVLGICGGMQLLNVVLGGTLVQDIRRELTSARDHEQTHERNHPHHPVEVKAGTLLGELIGQGQVMVNSTHHQAVRKASEKVRVSAIAPDGVIEAIEVPTQGFALGVQWHPELLIDTVPLHMGLFRGLVAHARETRR